MMDDLMIFPFFYLSYSNYTVLFTDIDSKNNKK